MFIETLALDSRDKVTHNICCGKVYQMARIGMKMPNAQVVLQTPNETQIEFTAPPNARNPGGADTVIYIQLTDIEEHSLWNDFMSIWEQISTWAEPLSYEDRNEDLFKPFKQFLCDYYSYRTN